jgi:hypothetical protein
MMNLASILLLAASLGVNAVPVGEGKPTVPSVINPAIDPSNVIDYTLSASRFSCGQCRFDDGTVQEFYSQVWVGLPADQMVCRFFKYEFRDKKGQEGKFVVAKVDAGCTCFFYE